MFEHIPLMQEAVSQDFLDRISPHDILPLAVVAIVFLAGTVIVLSKIIFSSWKRVRERQVAASLIQDMLDRNLSAPEIEQLLGAWAAASGGETAVPHRPPRGKSPQLPPKPVVS